MADNLTTQSATPATIPASSVIATDDAGAGGHVQIVKLAISTDGSATAIPADATNGIDVDVTRLPALVAGTANIGDVDVLTIAAGDNNIGNVDIVTMPTVTVNAHAVTNAGTFVVQENGAALTSLQLADDVVATLGTSTYTEATTKGTTVGAVRRDADTTLVDTTNEIGPLQMDANGRLKVEAFSGETLPVSLTSTTITGTVAATQSGTWTVQPGNTANTTAWKVDGSAVTQPVSAASLPLPTGAGTLAEQQTQTTALQLIDDIVYTDDTSTHSTGSSKGALIMAAAAPTDGSVNANDIGAVAMTTDRKLHVSVQDAIPAGTNNIGDVDILTIAAGDNNIGNVDIVTVPTDPFGANADAASATGSISAKLRFIAATGIPVTGTVTVASHAVTNAGTFVTQENGALLTSAQLIDDAIVADDAAFTPATTKVMMAGFEADETATDSVDEGDGGAARMTLDRKQIVTIQPHTAGGLSTFMASGSDGSSILVATAQAIKASAGQMYGYYAYNPEAAVTFVHFYNTAQGSVTVGTTNPLFTIAIPAGSAANLNIAQGITFSNAGWSCAATTTAGGNTAPATGVSLVVWYM